MKDNNDNFRSMSSALRGYVRAIGAEDKLLETAVLKQWEEFVGKSIAIRTVSKIIIDKTLIVELNSSVVRQELHRDKEELIKKVNLAAGKELIQDIFLK